MSCCVFSQYPVESPFRSEQNLWFMWQPAVVQTLRRGPSGLLDKFLQDLLNSATQSVDGDTVTAASKNIKMLVWSSQDDCRLLFVLQVFEIEIVHTRSKDQVLLYWGSLKESWTHCVASKRRLRFLKSSMGLWYSIKLCSLVGYIQCWRKLASQMEE